MLTSHSHVRGFLSLAVILGATVVVGVGSGAAGAAEKVRVIPAPAQDEPAGQATSEVSTGGRVLLSVQGVYQQVRGVQKVLSGYVIEHQEIVGFSLWRWKRAELKTEAYVFSRPRGDNPPAGGANF